MPVVCFLTSSSKLVNFKSFSFISNLSIMIAAWMASFKPLTQEGLFSKENSHRIVAPWWFDKSLPWTRPWRGLCQSYMAGTEMPSVPLQTNNIYFFSPLIANDAKNHVTALICFSQTQIEGVSLCFLSNHYTYKSRRDKGQTKWVSLAMTIVISSGKWCPCWRKWLLRDEKFIKYH